MKAFFIRSFLGKGFSLIELLTAVGIVGTLSIIGIKAYQNQMNKTKSAEARHSLSYVYIAEENFKETWDTYHENLIIIGAAPSGTYYYDVGFKKDATLSDTDGYLGTHYPNKAFLNHIKCANYYQICNGGCKSSIPAESHPYFAEKADNCNVTGSLLLKEETYTSDDEFFGEAKQAGFKALAIGRLKNKDVWSIDQEKVIEHVTDGTR